MSFQGDGARTRNTPHFINIYTFCRAKGGEANGRPSLPERADTQGKSYLQRHFVGAKNIIRCKNCIELVRLYEKIVFKMVLTLFMGEIMETVDLL